MSLFIPSIPQPGDNLDFSQGQLLSNNQGLDTVFGIDHYKFSDATVNKGFHNQVTTPAYVANPPTSAPPVTGANPIFYSFQLSANLGVIQFSRGPNNVVPSAVTMLQSPASATSINTGAFSPVFDFTGLNRALCILTSSNMAAPRRDSFAYVVWTGTTLTVNTMFTSSLGGFGAVAAGNVVQLFNTTGTNMTNVYWTLEFLRVE